MSKRRTDDEVTRLLKDADRDLAKGLTVSDFCRKVGVAQTTSHRWRQRHDPMAHRRADPVRRRAAGQLPGREYVGGDVR